MKLVLFDIDGTLVPYRSVKSDYWHAAIKKHFSLDVNRDSIETQGKTDRLILFELLKLAGIMDPESDIRFGKTLNDLGNLIRKEVIETGISALPGVVNVLQGLAAEKDVVLGILTGNTRSKSEIKLGVAGISNYFRVFAFGEDTMVRSELVPVAARAAEKMTGRIFTKSDIMLVGDTVRDIACAREAGVGIMAVATGSDSYDVLRNSRPDLLVRDYNMAQEIISMLL